MTAQDRINELCQQALRRGDWNDTREEKRDPGLRVSHDGETTILFRQPSDEETVVVRAAQPLLPEAPAPASPSSPAPVSEVMAATPVEDAGPGEKDSGLANLIEEREVNLGRRHKRARILVNTLIGLVVLGPVTAVAVSPKLHRTAISLIGQVREGVEDARKVGHAPEQDDHALEAIRLGAGDELSGFGGEEAESLQARNAELRTMGRFASKFAAMGAGGPAR